MVCGPTPSHERASAWVAPVMDGPRERGGRVAALIVRVATICYDYADEARSRRLWENELPRSKLRGINPPNPETVVVRTALARQFGGVDHGVSCVGTTCGP